MPPRTKRKTKPAPPPPAPEDLFAKMSTLEREFAVLWDEGWPEIDLQVEYRFKPSRRWRFDFAHEDAKVAIEIEGGIWLGNADSGTKGRSRSRHTTAVGFQNDCEKYLAAIMLGWQVVRLTGGMITVETLEKIHQLILVRLEQAMRVGTSRLC